MTCLPKTAEHVISCSFRQSRSLEYQTIMMGGSGYSEFFVGRFDEPDVDATGMTDVPVENRTNLPLDNGAGYLSKSFRDYLHLVGIWHILVVLFYPQTNGKLERYHQSIKKEVNQLLYEAPSQLEKDIIDFVDYYNYHRYHKALGNMTPADALYSRRERILQRRKEVQIQTINRRRDYNQSLNEFVNVA
ncbi:integrase core domain-containing protein [Chloroflexota bacterium]